MARQFSGQSPEELEALAAGAKYFDDQNKAAAALAETLARLTPLQRDQAYQMGLALQASKQLAAANQQLNSAYQQSMRAVYGWATAGLAGTTMGERLLFQQQMLRREISQLFLPAIEKVSQWLDQIIRRFRQLTGEQQENIGRWLLSGTAMLGLLTLMPKLAGWLDTIRKSWTMLSTVLAANPFLAAAAGVAVLMAQTQEGRSQLEEIGTQLLGVFEQVASVLGAVLLPILERLSEFLSSGVGKIIVWGAVFVTAIRMIQAAFSGLALTMLGAGAILGGLIAVVGLLALAFQKSELRQFGENLAKQVRAGKISMDQAVQELEAKAAERRFELEEKYGGHEGGISGLAGAMQGEIYRKAGIDPGELARQQAGEELEQERARLLRAAQGKRNELLLSQTAQEDPRQTIQRIQSVALRIRTPTDENTEKTAGYAGQIAEMMRRAIEAALPGKKDNRDRPPKED